jgi:chromosome segregation ATPase
MDATQATIESAPASAQEVHALVEPAAALEPAEPSGNPQSGEEPTDAAAAKVDRRKLEEQLHVLKRKEFELRRALVIADHPELADVIRVLEGRAYALTRAEAKLAQGLTKAEERRRETTEKKLSSLREKRAELDAQIGALESELRSLGAERMQVFEAEQRQALEQLLVALGTHEPALRAAELDAASLVPELAGFLPKIQALAETLVAARDAS